MISIIIPVFNEEEYLKFCLDSIICQYNYGNLEVIVIDDASTDRTFDIPLFMYTIMLLIVDFHILGI